MPKDHLGVVPDDVLLVCGPAVDEATTATVVDVVGRRIRVELRAALASTTRSVQVLQLALLRRGSGRGDVHPAIGPGGTIGRGASQRDYVSHRDR